MTLDGFLNFLSDLTVKLTLPFSVIPLRLLGHTSLDLLPLFEFEIVQPELVLKQIKILRLNNARDFLLADSAFEVGQITFRLIKKLGTAHRLDGTQ